MILLANTKTTGFKRLSSDIKQFSPLLSNLVARDFKVKYRRSFLGVAWSILNPLLTMLVLTKVFSVLLKINASEVKDFASYYIIGSSLWTFFSESTTASLNSILEASNLIKKVYIPKYVFPLEKCLFSLVNFAFSLIAVFAVVVFNSVTKGIPMLSAYSIMFPLPVIYCFVFACGMSLFLSAVTVYFRDVAHLYGVLLTMWIYLTPILYPIEFVKNYSSNSFGSIIIKRVVLYNPMTHYVMMFRDVMMFRNLPTLNDHIYCMITSFVVFLIGAFVFNRAQSKFILHI